MHTSINLQATTQQQILDLDPYCVPGYYFIQIEHKLLNIECRRAGHYCYPIGYILAV